MTVDELREIAEDLGYRLVKLPPKRMVMECTCGCNRRTEKYKEDRVIIECMRCGRMVIGKNKINARVNWNKEIEREMEREEWI